MNETNRATASAEGAYPANLHISHLDPVSACLLTSVRLWSLKVRYPQRKFPCWRDGLRAIGLEVEGLGALNALMTAIIRNSNRLLDIRCSCNQRLGLDEGELLQVIALIQAGKQWQAASILQDWLSTPGKSMALLHAANLADFMALSEIELSVYGASPQGANVFYLHQPTQSSQAACKKVGPVISIS